MRLETRILHSLRRKPHNGLGRAKRAKEILATSRGALWGHQGTEPLGWLGRVRRIDVARPAERANAPTEGTAVAIELLPEGFAP